MEQQSHSEIVRAPIETCFDTIVDFKEYPSWFSGISAARIDQADPERGQWTIYYELNMVIKTISYTLAYQGERPHGLSWKLVSGDVSDVEGSYRFTKLEDDVTEAECSQAVEIGFWIPGPFKRTFEKSALVDSVREFKSAAERRAGVA